MFSDAFRIYFPGGGAVGHNEVRKGWLQSPNPPGYSTALRPLPGVGDLRHNLDACVTCTIVIN